MSKVQLSGNANGTGIFTIASPNSNTDRTLTLPDAAGTLALQGGAGVGKILQVVQATSTTATNINTTTETAITGVTASITPSSTSSRIFVVINIGEFRVAFQDGARFQLYRNGSKIVNMINEVGYSGTLTATAKVGLTFSWSYVDSPSSTSSLTYALYGRKLLNLDPVALEIMPNASSTASIILMEVAG